MLVALLLTANALDPHPLLSSAPVTLLVSSALLISVAVVMKVLASGFAFPASLRWPAFVFALLLVGIFPIQSLSGYALEKISLLYTVSLLCAVAPAVLLSRPGGASVLNIALAALGIILAAEALFLYLVSGMDIVRMAAEGTSSIAFGHAVGRSLILVVLWWLLRGGSRKLALAIPLAFVVLGSDSRASLLFGAFTVVVLVLLFHADKYKKVLRFGALGAAFPLLWTLLGDRLPARASQRLTNLMSSDPGESVTSRLESYERSLNAILANPLGYGWGSFGDVTGMFQDVRVAYPHNMFIEIAFEAGVIPAVLIFSVFGYSLVRIARIAKHNAEAQGIFAMLLFALLCSMTSFDINGQRAVFAFSTLALAYPRRQLGWSPTAPSPPSRPAGATWESGIRYVDRDPVRA